MVKKGVIVYPFGDASGVLFYNTYTDESIIVDVSECIVTQDTSCDYPTIMSVSENIKSVLISKGFLTSD